MSTLQTTNLKHPDASGNQITFTSAGSVGIGTTSASNQGANFNNLVVGNTSGNNGITILTGSNNDGIINFNNADDSDLTGYLIYEHSTDSLRFGTAGTGDKMRIRDGNVGIGTGTPNGLLTLQNGNVNNVSGSILQMNLGPNGYWQIEAANGNNSSQRALRFINNNGSASSTLATILQNGNLGINTTGPAAKLDVNGNQTSNVVAMAALDVDCSAGNYFTKTINGNSTFTFSNVPSSRSFSFVLELTHTSGTVTWPSSVKFPGDTAPTLTAGKTHLFVFETNDGGTRFRGAALVDYVN